jgi:aryl-alcohol dehydrogenase-like predicted oxidoreductase
MDQSVVVSPRNQQEIRRFLGWSVSPIRGYLAGVMEPTTFGSTGLRVSRLGIGAGYGLGAEDVEHAVEHGVSYLYWGSRRRSGWDDAIRRMGPAKRDGLVLVVQSYTRIASMMRGSLERALRALGTDHVDVLLLGWWDQPPPRKLVDAAVALREAGKTKAILVSCHHRPSFAGYIDDPAYDGIMVRYNAAHVGAEQEVFPHLARRRVGVVAYTATRWGALLDPKFMPPGEPLPRASDCYRFVLANPHVDVALSGPRNREELDEALTALQRGPMSADELAWMRRVGAHVHEVARRQPLSVASKLGDRLVAIANRVSHACES